MHVDEVNKLQTDSKILRDWLDSIPFGEYNNVLNRLFAKCLVKRHTFNNWRYGQCRIPMASKRDINSVAMEVSGVEIFTIDMPERNLKA